MFDYHKDYIHFIRGWPSTYSVNTRLSMHSHASNTLNWECAMNWWCFSGTQGFTHSFDDNHRSAVIVKWFSGRSRWTWNAVTKIYTIEEQSCKPTLDPSPQTTTRRSCNPLCSILIILLLNLTMPHCCGGYAKNQAKHHHKFKSKLCCDHICPWLSHLLPPHTPNRSLHFAISKPYINLAYSHIPSSYALTIWTNVLAFASPAHSAARQPNIDTPLRLFRLNKSW